MRTTYLCYGVSQEGLKPITRGTQRWCRFRAFLHRLTHWRAHTVVFAAAMEFKDYQGFLARMNAVLTQHGVPPLGER